jgi:hypothetical protein
MKPSFAPLAALALLGVASAQQPSPFRFVPADAQFVLRVASPARWHQQFVGSKFANLLASDAVAPWLAKGRDGLAAAMAEAREKGGVDVDVVERWLAEYRGDMVFAISVDFTKVGAAIQNGEPPPMVFSLTLPPDGKFDLATLAATIAKSAEAEDEAELRDLTIGEHKLRGSETGPGMTITLPTLIDGHLVMLGGFDLEKQGARWLADEDRMTAAREETSLWGRAELEGAMSALIEFAATAGEENGAPMDIARLLRDLGLGAIESCTGSIARHADGAALDLALATKTENRGLLDLFPAELDAAKMLRWLPPGVDAYSVTPFDVGALYGLVERIWGGLADVVPMTFDDAMAAMAEATKVRLKEDLLDHVGKGLMVVQNVASAVTPEAIAAAADEENLFGSAAGCYGLLLRDGKAFGASLETLLRSRGLHAARKSEDYAATKVHRLRLAGLVELEYAVTEELLLIAIGGEEPGNQLRGVLDARTAGAAANLPKAAAAHVAALPKGWIGLQVSPIGQMLRSIGQAVEALAKSEGAATESVEEITGVMRTLGDALEAVGLGTMVGAIYIEPTQIKVRTLW